MDLLEGDELAQLLAGVTSGDSPSLGQGEKHRFIPDCSPEHVRVLDLLRTTPFPEDLEIFTRSHDAIAGQIGDILGMKVSADFSGDLLVREFARSVPEGTFFRTLRFLSGRFSGFIGIDPALEEFITDDIADKIAAAIDGFPSETVYLNTAISKAVKNIFPARFDRLVFCRMTVTAAGQECVLNIGYDANLAARMLGLLPPFEEMFRRDAFYIGSVDQAFFAKISRGKKVLLPEEAFPLFRDGEHPIVPGDGACAFADRLRYPLTLRFSRQMDDIKSASGENAELFSGGNRIAHSEVRESGKRKAAVIVQMQDPLTSVPLCAEIGRGPMPDEGLAVGNILRLGNDHYPNVSLFAGSDLFLGEGEAVSCDGVFGLRMLNVFEPETKIAGKEVLRYVLAQRDFPCALAASMAGGDTVVFNGSFTGDIMIYEGWRPAGWGQLCEEDDEFSIRVTAVPDIPGENL